MHFAEFIMFSKKQQKDQNYLISISAKPNSVNLIKWFGFCRIYYVQQKTAKDQNYLISISAKPNSIWSNGLDFAELIMFSKKQQKTKTIWFLLNLWKNSNQVKTFFPHLLQNLFCSAKHLLQNLFYLCRLPSAVILQTLWNVSSAWSILSFHRFCRMRL